MKYGMLYLHTNAEKSLSLIIHDKYSSQTQMERRIINYYNLVFFYFFFSLLFLFDLLILFPLLRITFLLHKSF